MAAKLRVRRGSEGFRFFDFELRHEGRSDGLTIEGYASVFNVPYDVTDQLGTYREIIAPGAFTQTLSQRMPVMQFNHGHDVDFGELPIGVWTRAEEDDHGLFLSGKVHDPSEDSRAGNLIAAINSGAVKSQSIRMQVIHQDPEDFGPEHDERTILDISLLEAGPVVWAASETTTVGMRSKVLESLDAMTDEEVAILLSNMRSAVAHSGPGAVPTLGPADTPELAAVDTERIGPKQARQALARMMRSGVPDHDQAVRPR